jgi:hypothetical protein
MTRVDRHPGVDRDRRQVRPGTECRATPQVGTHRPAAKIVKLVYVLATIGLGLTYLLFVVGAFSRNAGAGVVVLLVGAVLALVYLAFIRMTLEFYFAIVRMSPDINQRLPRM